MPRIAKRPEPKSVLVDYAGSLASAAGQRISDNPTIAGASVAFAVVMFFVSSNALFYQPFRHKDAFFTTRSMDNYTAPVLPKAQAALKPTRGKSDRFEIARETNSDAAKRPSDPTLADIQSALAKMKLYSGTVDGLQGPKTREAIQKFQQEAGLAPTGEIDPLLIDAIRTASIPVAKVPAPLPRQKASPEPSIQQANAETFPQESTLAEADLMKIQAGLKAFGNDDIDVDGKIGAKTRDAVREFQSLFQLAVSGDPNREVFEKLQEIGLISG
ncbi:MAG: peptidoglycan-binding domain-containing protein [Rhizobiaceae bacterium]